MTWTVEDEREYQELLRLREVTASRARGEETLRKASENQPLSRPPTEEEQKAGFSLTRMVGGAFQDVYNGLADLQNYLTDPATAFGKVGRGVPGLKMATLTRSAVEATTGQDVLGLKQTEIIEDSVNPWERGGRSLISFLVPYVPAGKYFGAFRSGLGFTSRASRSLAAASAVNVSVMDATENNLANTLRDDFGFDNDVLDALATEEDDDLLEGRVKMALANLPVDLLAEGAVEGAVRLARVYRGVRSNNQATRDLIEVTKQDITVSREAARKAAEANETSTLRLTGDTAAAPETPTTAPSGSLVQVGEGEVVVKASQVKERPITSLEEFVMEVRTQFDAVADPAQLERIAKALIDEPHEALSMMNIDPAKLDYSVFADAEALKALQNSLGDIIDDVAKKTGRSKVVVSNKETLKAARILATQPKELKRLLRDTKGLASRLTAGRLMVGSHAHRLLETADAAAKEIKSGGAGKAYSEFLQSLETHGYMLGVLRGAGSEVGRALQSLQMRVDVSGQIKSLSETAEDALRRADQLKTQRLSNPEKAAKSGVLAKVDVASDDAVSFLKEVAEGRIDLDRLGEIAKAAKVTPSRAAKEMGLDLGDLTKAKKANEAYESIFKDLQTDAGRLRMIDQLQSVKGDLSKLSRVIKRRERTGWLDKTNDLLRDTTGALFSVATSIFNVAGAFSILTLKGVTHQLAYLGLKGGALITRNQDLALAARMQGLKSWATFHAPAQAFGTAFSRAWAELKGAGLDEAAFAADGLKLNELATGLQAAANEARKGTDRLFLKEDFASPRGFTVQPETLNNLSKDIEQWPIGRLGQLGVEWFLRSGAAAVNTAGAGFRMGTSMFVNAPDRLSGAFATRVGQHTAAVDIAAKEAAEAGLEGDALMAFLRGRSIELADMIDDGTIGADPFNNGYQDMFDKAGLDVAQEVNFSDELEYSISRWASGLGNVPIVGTLVLPFPKTPLRVMEKSIIDYTPLYGIKKATRDAWTSGDAEVRGEIAARFSLTLALMSGAWSLASDDTIVGFDGGWRNTARRERGQYTIRIFDDIYEYNRLDPLGTVLGLMADIKEISAEGADNRELIKTVEGDEAMTRQLAWDMAEAVFFSIFKNVLSKSYLDSLEQVNAMAAAQGVEQFGTLLESWAGSLATRAVPLSGTQRQFEKLEDPTMRLSRGIIEGMVKATFASDTLPVRRDAIFGRPMEFKAGERLVGLKGGPVETNPIDQELARLSFDIQMPRWKQLEVDLSSAQMSRFLELRGHTVEIDGMTLEDAVTAFIKDPRYAELTDEAKVEGIKGLIRPYTTEARNQLIREDDDFAFKAIVASVRDEFRLQGRDQRELMPEAERIAKEFGINRNQ